MASRSEALPAAEPLEAIDQAGRWFWNFLKVEISPYPGRAGVGRKSFWNRRSALIICGLPPLLRKDGAP